MSVGVDGVDELVGIMPAAGWARRSAASPCSKEVFPIGLLADDRHSSGMRIKPACDDLLRGFRHAGAKRAVVVLRPGKWDIPTFLGDGADYELALAYVTIADSPGVPWTVRAALPLVNVARVLFGFPDLGIQPADALKRVAERQRDAGAEIALGLFPAHRPELVDMVDVDAEGRVRDVIVKPRATDRRLTWLVACWSPAFSDYIRQYVNRIEAGTRAQSSGEIHLGDVIRAAVHDGQRVIGVAFNDGSYTDFGALEGLKGTLPPVD